MHYNDDYSHLIELQKLDNKIDALKDELENLPQKIAEMELRIQELERELVAIEEELKGKELALREKNSEYRDERDKLALYKKQLLDIKNNEEYRAMLQQIENQEKVIERVEDEIIILEEELDELKNSMPERKESIKKEINAVKEEKQKLGQMDVVLKKDMDALINERKKIEEYIKISVLRKYERLRARGYRKVLVPIKKIKGTEGEEYVCSACNSTVPLEISLKVKQGEAFLRCENCGRYLYYENEEVE